MAEPRPAASCSPGPAATSARPPRRRSTRIGGGGRAACRSAVDVDADPELQAEYGDRVPVVLLDGREHSYFTVDVVRLRRDLGLLDRPADRGHPTGHR